MKLTSPFTVRAHFAARSFHVLNIALSHNKHGLIPLKCIKIAFGPPIIRYYSIQALKKLLIIEYNIWNFVLHLSFKTIFKELDSDFTDAIKLMC